ncbi:ATP-dependent DNA helicase, partial [Morganella morganii]|nr:ATP-dependent DNA helicase [Morganella morganii]
ASQYFGQQLSSRQLSDLTRDIPLAYRSALRDQAQLQKWADRPTMTVQAFRLALGATGFRGNLREPLPQLRFLRALSFRADALEVCYDVMTPPPARAATLA